MSPAYKRLLKVSRTVHVYLTLFGLAVILFFAVTGFMLNHPHWFVTKKEINWEKPDRVGTVPRELLVPLDRLAVVEYLRRHHRVTGFLGGDIREMYRDDIEDPRPLPRALDMEDLFRVPAKVPEDTDVKPVELKFAQPGKLTEVRLWLEDEPAKPDAPAGSPPPRKAGDVLIGERSEGWAGVMLDLHKSKSSGYAWAWLIDITCGLLVVISITGLVLWSSLKTRGKWGAVMMLLGTMATLAVYFLGVPW